MTKTITERAARAAAAALCALACSGAAFAAPSPEPPRGRPAEYEATQALFGRAGIFEPMARADERWQYDRLQPYKELTVGSYARVERHLKIGAFYRLQFGARHDDDWKSDSPGVWNWRDTSERPESLFVLDATPRVEIPFLPGGHWVGSLKLRGEHNFFNKQNTLFVGPELAWFWMNGLVPRATLFLRYETWLPLNFGETRIYERWYYLAALWHANSWLSIGPSIALRDETWTTSSQFRSLNPGADYKVQYRSWVPGLTVVAHLR